MKSEVGYMMPKNGLIIYKNKWLSFINKEIMFLLLGVMLVIIVPCSYLMLTYWQEMPIFIKIFWPILLTIILIGIVITPLNGMVITKNGNILFLPDFRLIKVNIKKLKRITIIFNEWKNNKYYAIVKLVYNDEKYFIKDYSKQFRNMKNKKLAMSMYTITKKKIDRICNKLVDLNICSITIIDMNRNIVYQSK